MTIDFFFILLFNAADNHRPYLITFQSNESTDYVNAVFVDVSKIRCIASDEYQL